MDDRRPPSCWVRGHRWTDWLTSMTVDGDLVWTRMCGRCAGAQVACDDPCGSVGRQAVPA